MAERIPLIAKQSHDAGYVTVKVELQCSGWHEDRARISGSTKLTTEQARILASALISLADKADAKIAAKTAADTRRQKWRDQQIAAGRMVVFNRVRP